jgi:hypothetical protein
LDEYIPKVIYGQWEHKPGVLLRKINPKLIIADQLLRDQFGEVIINNWWTNGPGHIYNFRGWRPRSYNEGGELSDHREGNASDKTFVNYESEEVREWIKKNYQRLGITVIESGVSWVHSSVAYTSMSNLWIVTP